MSGYFARLAQRSDIAPAVIAPRASAAVAHSDGDALEQHTEVIVTPAQDTGVTASSPASSASPPAGATIVSSSSSALPDPIPAKEAGTVLPPSAPAPQASVHRAPRIVATAATQPAGSEAHRPTFTADDSAPAATHGGDQAQPVSSVIAATPLHKEIPATRQASAGSVARHHDAATHTRAGEYAEPRSPRDATATSPSTIPGTDDESLTRPTSRAMPILRTGTQSTQTAAAAARAQLQVHIGRIELEVHQPSPAIAPPAAAPPPAQPVDRAARSASFNPHRYYLRSSW